MRKSSSTPLLTCGDPNTPAYEVVVLDFETTGLSPPMARVIEVGAFRVRQGQVLETFHTLMNPGCIIPHFITSLTGITNDMLRKQPCPEEVMPRLHSFIGNRPLVAHNASFDARFLKAELARCELEFHNPVFCTVKLARRLMPGLASYRLQTLATHLGFSATGCYHRAIADAEVTAQIWSHLESHLTEHLTGFPTPDAWMRLQKTPAAKISNLIPTNKTSNHITER